MTKFKFKYEVNMPGLLDYCLGKEEMDAAVEVLQSGHHFPYVDDKETNRMFVDADKN
jgi:hypothetical protein